MPRPRGIQKIMAKYTKLVMWRLYKSHIDVSFGEFSTDQSSKDIRDLKGVYMVAPLFKNDEDDKGWDEVKQEAGRKFYGDPYPMRVNAITYNSKYYSEKKLDTGAWTSIVHEVTHYEEKEDLDEGHTDTYWNIFNKNLMKVKDLQSRFDEEIHNHSRNSPVFM